MGALQQLKFDGQFPNGAAIQQRIPQCTVHEPTPRCTISPSNLWAAKSGASNRGTGTPSPGGVAIETGTIDGFRAPREPKFNCDRPASLFNRTVHHHQLPSAAAERAVNNVIRLHLIRVCQVWVENNRKFVAAIWTGQETRQEQDNEGI